MNNPSVQWHRTAGGINIKIEYEGLTPSEAFDIVTGHTPFLEPALLRQTFDEMEIAPPLPQKISGLDFQFDGYTEILRLGEDWYAILFPNLSLEQATEILTADNPIVSIDVTRERLLMAMITPPREAA